MLFANFFSKLKNLSSNSTNNLDDSENNEDPFFNEEKKSDTHHAIKNLEISPHHTTTLARSTHQVNSITELNQAIKRAIPHDTIIITRSGRYGKIRLTNKSQLTIKALNTDMPIEASFFIEGSSQQITIENMQLWHNIANSSQIIITAKTTHSIIIQHCILSTVAVKRSVMLNTYSGHPRSWNNGIRMLGNNGQIINNTLINLNLAISQTGPNTIIKHNHIQFYSEDAIRISHHGVHVENNTIYDSVIKRTGQNAHKDAIQLIPPENRFNGGTLNNITITGNIIQSNSTAVTINEQGTVQGIFGSDGHFVNTIITDNIIAVNSDHGITLNGVKNARISNNRILDQTPTDHFKPGIKLYLTRVSQGGKQSWLANLSYSVQLDNNQAPILNTPDEAYSVNDVGDNRIPILSYDLARGNSPIIIRNTHVITKSLSPAKQKSSAQKESPQQNQSTNQINTHIIHNKEELKIAIEQANEGDTLLIKKENNYGTIRLRHKKGICLKAVNKHLIINACIVIDGTSNTISIENMNLWHSEKNWKPVILSTPSTHQIQIKNCLISSTPFTPNHASNTLTDQISRWTTGIWLRGTNNQIENNHIVNINTGIMASGRQTQIKNNLIQFYSDKGIRVFNHDIQVKHNTICDAIRKRQGKQYDNIAIQLLPPEGRFETGELNNIELSHNTIQLSSSTSTITERRQGQVQGIIGKSGYMVNLLINDNTIITNTEHGIVLYGVSNLTLRGNKVSTHDKNTPFIAGIRLYYTRTIDLKGTRQQQWHHNRPYSVRYKNNKAPVFNIPNKNYQIHDEGGNHFDTTTSEEGRGKNPIII